MTPRIGATVKILLAVVLALSLSADAFAQASAAPANTQAGRTKMLWGAGLILGGLFVMPVTSFGGSRGGDDNAAVGMTMIGGGTALIVWGMRDRYKAANPQLTFGVAAHRTKGVFLRRTW
jgi:hypothetical protein